MSEQTGRQDILAPFLAVLGGAVVPYHELVQAGRMIAGALVAQGKTLTFCMDTHWAGVWDLERLTDGEVVDWGLWVATQASTPGR